MWENPGGFEMSDLPREEMESTESEGPSRLAWFLTGAVIGVTAALLYAPKAGRETREYLSGKGRALGDAPHNLIETGREMFDRGRQLVEDAADLFERGRKLVRG
jgi:gas vesicle protein